MFYQQQQKCAIKVPKQINVDCSVFIKAVYEAFPI